MKKRKYFLVIENQTKTDFIRLKNEDGIKVFLPSYIPTTKLKKISTESGSVYGKTPELCINTLKHKYTNYDIFYLNIIDTEDRENYKPMVNFKLSLQPNLAVAFVCIPKNAPRYKHDPRMYLGFDVGFNLEKYYNDYKIWTVYIVDENFSKNYLDKCYFFRRTARYEQSEKAFFEKCRHKYGIPQTEIGLIKYIMRTDKKNVRQKAMYMLTPDFMKKVHQKKKSAEHSVK